MTIDIMSWPPRGLRVRRWMGCDEKSGRATRGLVPGRASHERLARGFDLDDAPAFPLEYLPQDAIENLAVGGGDLQAESIETGRHNLQSHFNAGFASKARQKLAVPIFDGPTGGHDACSCVAADVSPSTSWTRPARFHCPVLRLLPGRADAGTRGKQHYLRLNRNTCRRP
jgi:hypothetical protein